MPSKGTLRLIKGDDEGGEHGNENGLVRKTLCFRYGYPVHGIGNCANVFLIRSIKEEFPCIVRGKDPREEGGSHNSDEKGEVMDRLCTIVILPDPSISAPDIRSVRGERGDKVQRKGCPIEDCF